MAFPIRTAALIAATAGFTAAHAADVPTLDISRTCRPLLGIDVALDTDRCLTTEREARDQLAREWANFPAADRTLCAQTAAMGGLPSYVELITCLEMKRDVAKLPPDRGLISRPSGLPTR